MGVIKVTPSRNSFPARLGAGILGGIRGVGSSLFDLVFPGKCAGCEEGGLRDPDRFWCSACRSLIQWVRSPLCTLCGKPFPKSPDSPDHLCGECLLSTFQFDVARSSAVHAGAVRDSIHALKFGGRLHHVPALVQLLIELIESAPDVWEGVIVPVPLHTRRLRQRGFNQAGLLARELGRRLQRTVRFDVLQRKQWTEPQTRLNREERLSNVRNAFQVVLPGEVKDGRILLLDDVYTTGSTLSECAGELKRAGAREVVALTVTRSVPELNLTPEAAQEI